MAKEPKYPLPDLSNVTPGHCIDQIAEYREMQKRGKFYEGVYRRRWNATRDLTTNVTVGDVFIGTITPNQTERIVPDLVRAFFQKMEGFFAAHWEDEKTRPKIEDVMEVSEGNGVLNIARIEAAPPKC